MTVIFVMRNQQQAAAFNKALPPNADIRAIWPAISQIAGRPAETIIVNHDVDLWANVDHEGLLVDILRNRQRSSVNPKFVVLPR